MKVSHKVNLKNSPNLTVMGQILGRVVRVSVVATVRALNNPYALIVLHLPPFQRNVGESINRTNTDHQGNNFRFLPLNRTQFTAVHVNRARRIG